MAGKSKTGIFYGWVIVAAASIIVALVWGCDETYVIFLPELCEELGWTRTAVSGAYSLGFIVATVLGIVAGRLNDRYGPRLILIVCLVISSVGFALMYTMKTTWQLYLFYGVIANVGMGFAWVPAISTVARWFIRKRGMALGIAEAGIGIGLFIMPPLIQFLMLKFGWRASYLILSGLLLVIGLPVSRLMRLNPSEKGLYPDGIRGTTENNSSGKLVPNTVDFTPKQAIRTSQFGRLFLINTMYSLRIGIAIHLKAYMISFGIPEMTAATGIGLRSGAYTVGAIIISKLSDRIGRKIPLFISFLVMALMMLWLVKARQPWEFYLYFVIAGFSAGSFVLFPAIIGDWFGLKFHGSILGLLDLATGIGASIGPLLAGYIFDTRGSYELAIIITAVGLFIATGLSLVIEMPQKQNNLAEGKQS